MNERTWRLKRLCVMAMICAMAYVLAAIVKIPIVLWLSYEPKDVLLTIGSFIFGPISAAAMSVVVSFVEMVTVSRTGIFGMIMNIVSSCLFACTAGAIYSKRRRLSGAIIGLLAGTVAVTVGMLLWNYLIVPLYSPDTPREQVLGMLIPVFLPFNLIKASLNSIFTVLLYKHAVAALRATKLIPPSTQSKPQSKTNSIIIAAVSLFLLATITVILLIWQGII